RSLLALAVCAELGLRAFLSPILKEQNVVRVVSCTVERSAAVPTCYKPLHFRSRRISMGRFRPQSLLKQLTSP
ncbi:MAG: hypothetical protein V3V75_07665, partial [Thermoguttaceae bacterium]